MKEKMKYACIYGHIAVGACPLVVMLLGILVCAFTGNRSPICYWSAGFLSIIAGFFTYKDKEIFSEALITSMGDKVLCTVIFAWLFSGIMAKILSVGELALGLIWLTSVIEMPTFLIPLVTFLVGAIMSTATGTSMGTIAAMTPLMVPVASTFGCDVALTCGAVVSGAAFGDNLAPVSDTTIASALTQETDIGRVVRSRLKYSLVAGSISAVLFIIYGYTMSDSSVASSVTADPSAVKNLIFLLIPTVVVALMLKQANIVTAILVGDFIGVVLLFLTGKIDFVTFVGSNGLIASGISDMVNVILFTWFIFVISGIVRKTGAMDALIVWLGSKAKSAASAELVCAVINAATVFCIVSCSAACALCGPITRQIMKPYHVARDRSANMLDGFSVGICALLPYGPMGLSAVNLAQATGYLNIELSVGEIIPYIFHASMLVLIFAFAAITGWGRTFETDEMLAKEGIYIDPKISIQIPTGAKISRYKFKGDINITEKQPE